MNPPVLVPPNPGEPLILYISETKVSLGALLAQDDSTRKERAIYYISRNLTGHELNYTFIEKACLAVVFTSQKFRHYMLAHTIKLVTKIDPLKYLLSKATLIGRLAKWVMILSEFDIHYIDRRAIKGQAIADQLADAPLQAVNSMQIEFPDADIFTITTKKSWALYFDGSYMQHGSRARILFVMPEGHTSPKSYQLMFPCTNNIAEYEALLTGMKIALEWQITELEVYGDSQLVINQINDDYQTKDDKLVPYKNMVDNFKKYFVTIKFSQISRIDNKDADAMATIASMLQLSKNQRQYKFLVEQLFSPTYDNPESHTICNLTRSDFPLHRKIYSYLKDDVLPLDLS
jgi:ribonuclease HI